MGLGVDLSVGACHMGPWRLLPPKSQARTVRRHDISHADNKDGVWQDAASFPPTGRGILQIWDNTMQRHFQLSLPPHKEYTRSLSPRENLRETECTLLWITFLSRTPTRRDASSVTQTQKRYTEDVKVDMEWLLECAHENRPNVITSGQNTKKNCKKV